MTPLPSDFGALLAETPVIGRIQTGEVVAGRVIFVSHNVLLVDVNGQYTGIISGTHLHSSIENVAEIQVGSVVDAIVIGDDRNAGLIVLSLKKASQIKLIEKLHANFDTKEIITVIPNEANKGGLLIDLDGIKGFIPVSQLTPLHYPRVEGANAERILEHLQKLVGKPFKVRVINVDQDGKKIIFSEKAAVAEERTRTLGQLKINDIVEGTVSGILTYGLFVTFEGVEGLVHVSEIDWGHVSDPSRFAKVGDKIKVQIIGIEQEKISLSMKRLKTNPWERLAEMYKVGDIVTAPVTKVSQFGIFLSLEGGINGLIHLSEIPVNIVKNINEVILPWQDIRAKIITFNIENKRIGLSIKALDVSASAEGEEGIANADIDSIPTKEVVTTEEVSKPARAPRTKKQPTNDEVSDVSEAV